MRGGCDLGWLTFMYVTISVHGHQRPNSQQTIQRRGQNGRRKGRLFALRGHYLTIVALGLLTEPREESFAARPSVRPSKAEKRERVPRESIIYLSRCKNKSRDISIRVFQSSKTADQNKPGWLCRSCSVSVGREGRVVGGVKKDIPQMSY